MLIRYRTASSQKDLPILAVISRTNNARSGNYRTAVVAIVIGQLFSCRAVGDEYFEVVAVMAPPYGVPTRYVWAQLTMMVVSQLFECARVLAPEEDLLLATLPRPPNLAVITRPNHIGTRYVWITIGDPVLGELFGYRAVLEKDFSVPAV